MQQNNDWNIWGKAIHWREKQLTMSDNGTMEWVSYHSLGITLETGGLQKTDWICRCPVSERRRIPYTIRKVPSI